MKTRPLIYLAVVLLAGCSVINPPRDKTVESRINDEIKTLGEQTQLATSKSKKDQTQKATSEADLLIPSLDAVLPKLGAPQREQRFDLTVTDAPISQMLSGLVVGTPYSILLKPQEVVSPLPVANAQAAPAAPTLPEERKVTLNLKNVTIFEVLDSVRELYGYDYNVEGTRIFVRPAALQTRLFQVNYIVGQRRGVSDIQVIGGAASNSGSGFASVQASGMTTLIKSDIWEEIEDSLRSLLGCTVPQIVPMTTQGAGGAAAAGGQTSGRRSDVSGTTSTQMSARSRGRDGCADGRSLTVSQMSGTIIARAMPNELRMVERILKSMQLGISRQVIIEAKIIDVELGKNSQQGVNWSAFRNGLHRFSVGADANTLGVNQPSYTAAGGGTVPAMGAPLTGVTGVDSSVRSLGADTTLANLLGTSLLGTANPNAFTAGLGMAVQTQNFASLINFLDTQGKVHVLSSPRISTMNNQQAVIKVGNEEPFVTNITGGTLQLNSTGASTSVTPPTLNYQPFFSGISLDVTPSIDEDDNVTLHVHTMVNSITTISKPALPNSTTTVPFATNSINQTDSVVRAMDGRVIVIGGLMTERTSDDSSGIPVARDVPGLGALFNRGNQSSSKRELVILLKPTVVKDETTWSDEVQALGERVKQLNSNSMRR